MPKERLKQAKQAIAGSLQLNADLARLLADTRRHVQRLTALRDMMQAITSAVDLQAVLDMLAKKIHALGPYAAVSVRLLQRQTSSPGPVEQSNRQEWSAREITNAALGARHTVQTDARRISRRRKHEPLLCVEVPLITKGKVLGVMSFYTREKHELSDDEIQFLFTLADHAAIAIDKSQLYEQAKEQTLRFEKTIIKRKRPEEELQLSREQLRGLAQHVQSVREMERERIARELHDEFGQALTVMKLDLSWLQQRLAKDQAPMVKKTKAMSVLIDTTMEMVRRICAALRPVILDDVGLIATMKWQAREFETRTGIECKLALPAEEIKLDRNQSTSIFRLFQENLTNVARHAEATKVEVALNVDGKSLILEVRDNGKGIKESEIYDARSLGLLGMRERVLLLSGEFHIRGVPGKGTTVTVRIPLSR